MGGSNSGALKGRRSWRMIFKQSSKQKEQKALSFENELDVHKEEEKGWRGYDKHKESDGHWNQLADDKSPTNKQTEKPPTQSPQCTCNNFYPKICWKLICWMMAKKKKWVKLQDSLIYCTEGKKSACLFLLSDICHCSKSCFFPKPNNFQ